MTGQPKNYTEQLYIRAEEIYDDPGYVKQSELQQIESEISELRDEMKSIESWMFRIIDSLEDSGFDF